MDPIKEADSTKSKNVIDMAITFSAMNRLFKKESKQKIAKQLECSLGALANCDDKNSFDEIHSKFCTWFANNVYTAEKKKKNNEIKKSSAASYGQAAKVFDVAAKVYVYYCHLPDCKASEKLLPMLHAAIDTLMMKNLKKTYPGEKIKATTIEAVDMSEYCTLQKLVIKHIQDKYANLILPVHYDDIMWHQLNRSV